MKLARITADNFMRLVAVDITTDQRVMQITGRNGAGKSAILNAIMVALAGKGALPSDPVRHGADSATITLDLGTYLVTRKIKPNGDTTLVVESREGARFPSPQKLLDKLLGTLSFDPEAFSRMKAKEQRDALAELAGLRTMLDDLAMHDRVDFDNRTTINRDLARAKAQLDTFATMEPVEMVDVSATLAEIRAAAEKNKEGDAISAQKQRYVRDAAALRETAAQKREQAARLLDEADEADSQAELADNAAASFVVPPVIDTSALHTRLEQAESINATARQYAERQKVAAVVADLTAQSDELTARMKAREAERHTVIAAAEFPVPDIAIGDDCVLYKGVPFDQASSAEQLRVSAAIGMRTNPTLRLMLIRDGSRLDEDSLAMLESAAELEDFVLLIESVDTSGKIGIYIEEGSVAAVNGVAVEAAAA